MKRLFLVVALAVAIAPHAGENVCLGTITSTGTSVTNLTTSSPFGIPPGAKITLYCDASGRLLVDNRTVIASAGATKGVPVASSTLFPTSVGRQNGLTTAGAPTALIAWISTTGTANCDVWQRDGNE